MQGAYVLVFHLDQEKQIRIGCLGDIVFDKGWYVYVGSALNSIEKRIQHHARKEKKLHWHIDYLLKYAKIYESFYKESIVHEECMIADAFEKSFTSIPRFGCSDCRCPSHLFTGAYNQIIDLVSMLKMKKS